MCGGVPGINILKRMLIETNRTDLHYMCPCIDYFQKGLFNVVGFGTN